MQKEANWIMEKKQKRMKDIKSDYYCYHSYIEIAIGEYRKSGKLILLLL